MVVTSTASKEVKTKQFLIVRRFQKEFAAQHSRKSSGDALQSPKMNVETMKTWVRTFHTNALKKDGVQMLLSAQR